MQKLIILFTFFLTGSVFAQQNKIDIGAEGGAPSFIFLRGNSFIKTNDRPTAGFSGGFFFSTTFLHYFHSERQLILNGKEHWLAK